MAGKCSGEGVDQKKGGKRRTQRGWLYLHFPFASSSIRSAAPGVWPPVLTSRSCAGTPGAPDGTPARWFETGGPPPSVVSSPHSCLWPVSTRFSSPKNKGEIVFIQFAQMKGKRTKMITSVRTNDMCTVWGWWVECGPKLEWYWN